jgi:NAD(P)-dependent dehydrogenase (short-subunit alcohol dehydrogenase family)
MRFIDGKITIITGAIMVRMLGFASAKAFVREGGKVVRYRGNVRVLHGCISN